MPALLLKPEDILISLFRYFPAAKREFLADRETLHTAFLELKKDDPELLEEFTFNVDKLFPKSEELDQAINNLEFSRFLKKNNPFLERYKIENIVDQYFSQRLETKFSQYVERFEILSQRLQSLLIF